MNRTQSQPRVFITQQPKPNGSGWTPNLSPATRYGVIHFIFSGSDNPTTDPDGAIFQASEALRDFNPETDYLLWPNGVDPFSVWAALIVLIKKDISTIKGLSWNRRITEDGIRDKQHGYYTPVMFRIPSTSTNLTSSKELPWPQKQKPSLAAQEQSATLAEVPNPQQPASRKRKASTLPEDGSKAVNQ